MLAFFLEPYSPRSACFSNVASATFTGSTIDTIAVSCEALFGLVRIRGFLRMRLVLKAVLKLYLLAILFNFFRKTTYIIYSYEIKWLNRLLQTKISLRAVNN